MKTTQTILDRVWSLWPSIETMARALGEEPETLRKLRDAGKLPKEQFDRLLVARAIYVNLPLSAKEIQRARLAKPDKTNAERERRKRQVADFIDKIGGPAVIQREAGLTPNSLHIARSRGRFSKAKRLELTDLARKRKVDLPDELFFPLAS